MKWCFVHNLDVFRARNGVERQRFVRQFIELSLHKRKLAFELKVMLLLSSTRLNSAHRDVVVPSSVVD